MNNRSGLTILDFYAVVFRPRTEQMIRGKGKSIRDVMDFSNCSLIRGGIKSRPGSCTHKTDDSVTVAARYVDG